VHYSKAGTVQPAAVNGGWLRIDFGKREFSTGLTLHNILTGQSAFTVAGSVRDDGIFAVNQSDTQLAGAVTFDSKEAGYFFEKSAGGGTFSGVTRWGR
jgi:hypothetical protein